MNEASHRSIVIGDQECGKVQSGIGREIALIDAGVVIDLSQILAERICLSFSVKASLNFSGIVQ
jgi:hypothetical protein